MMRFSLRTLLIFMAVVGAMLAVGLRAARFFRTEVGRGVTAEQANRLLWTCKVPSSATDVWFTSNRNRTLVECDIDEATFLNWAKELGADPLPLNNSPVKYRPI